MIPNFVLSSLEVILCWFIKSTYYFNIRCANPTREIILISKFSLEVLLQFLLTVEHSYTANCEVEEESRPLAGVDHGQDDGGHEDQNLHQQRPNDASRQGTAEKV